jgi:hypothetical protein
MTVHDLPDSFQSRAPDRRRRRSADPLVALHHQLASSRQEDSLEAIVVAEGSGVVVAAAGAWAVCEELAAYAPLLAGGVWTEPGFEADSRIAELRTRVDVLPVDVDGQTVLLCALGRSLRGRATQKAADAVVRILGKAA